MNFNVFTWPQESVVRIVTSDIFAGDAIGNFNLQLREFLQLNGIPCKLYAQHFDPRQQLAITPFDELFSEIRADDVVFSHFSIYEQRNERLSTLHQTRLVYYHGITPPEYFRKYDHLTEENCAKGRQQYFLFRDFDYFLANSGFMLHEFAEQLAGEDAELMQSILSRSSVIPPVISSLNRFDKIKPVAGSDSRSVITLLYVGRLAPHKCIHDLFDLLSGIIDTGADARLVIVGSVAAQSYYEELQSLLNGRYNNIKQYVVFPGHVSDNDLQQYYSTSDVFVTMSEHEGFCLPLIEAMHYGLPVVAKARAAIPETLSGSGILVDNDSYSGAVESIIKLHGDSIYRHEIIEKQNAVYENIIKRANGDEILNILRIVQQRL